MSDSRNFGLDVVRAIAIWCVLLAHLFASTFLAHLGFFGVEIFFVLSGFLIGRILVKTASCSGLQFAGVVNFWMRRWFRTLPAYYFYLILYYVFFKTGVLAGGKPDISYVFFLQNLFWPIGSFFEVSWSLSVEEWFYLICPVLLLIWIKVLRIHSAVLACVLTMLVGCLWLRSISDLSDWDRDIRKQVIYRLDAIGFGVLLAWVFCFKPALWERLRGVFFWVVGAFVFGAGVFAVSAGTRLPVALGFTLIPLGIILCLPGCYSLGLTGMRWFNCVVLYSSLFSYSAYLCHMLVFFFVERHFGGEHEFGARLLIRFFEVALIAICSAVSYFTIEKMGLVLRDRCFSGNEK